MLYLRKRSIGLKKRSNGRLIEETPISFQIA